MFGIRTKVITGVVVGVVGVACVVVGKVVKGKKKETVTEDNVVLDVVIDDNSVVDVVEETETDVVDDPVMERIAGLQGQRAVMEKSLSDLRISLKYVDNESDDDKMERINATISKIQGWIDEVDAELELLLDRG